MNKAKRLIGILAGVLLLSACGGKAPYELDGANIGGPFALIDQDGKTIRWSDFDGKYRLVYFGYAYCPDVCPLDLNRIMAGYRLFAESNPAAAAKLQPIFITVDPVRDTPEAIKTYVSAFPGGLVGLTGPSDEIERVKKAFVVVASKEGDAKATQDYLVSHSRTPFLFDPQGKPMALVPVQDGSTDEEAFAPEGIRDFLKKWVS
jgi:protein SCO1/2